MKCAKFWSVFLAAFSLLFCSLPQANAQWQTWPQWQRNGRIVNMATCQNGFRTDMSSKRWAEFVVYSASQTAITLPHTRPNMYEWYPHPNVFAFPSEHPVADWQGGQIVQMRWNNRPHTAIIIGTDETKIAWIDCNWGFPWNNGTVKYHEINIKDFEDNVGTRYSVYEIR